MKAKNMKVGTSVVIKDCASGYAGEFSGQTGVVDRMWGNGITIGADVITSDGHNVECYAYELRKAKEGGVK
jgi:hypothetical protein